MSELWPNHLSDTAEPAGFWGGAASVEPKDEVSLGCSQPTTTQLIDPLDERAELAALIASARSLQSSPQGLLAAMLVETVKRLVGDIVGRAPIDEALLQQRAEALAGLIGESTNTFLSVHPDDAALLRSVAPVIDVVSDPTLARGTIRICNADERAEDGVGSAMGRLHDVINAMGIEQ